MSHSTLAAVIMTPLLTTRLIGTLVPVDGVALFLSTLQVVLAPVIVGVALKRFFPRTIEKISPYSPLVAVRCKLFCLA
jgi:BASS family bile acid:Na+ symporter